MVVGLFVVCSGLYFAPNGTPRHICKRVDGTTCITTMDFAKGEEPLSLYVWYSWQPTYQYVQMMASFIGLTRKLERKYVTVQDARNLCESPQESWRKRGFALLNMPIEVQDYHSKDGQAFYAEQVVTTLRQLFPNARSISLGETSYRFQRGRFQYRIAGTKSVTVGAPHLDMEPNWTKRVEFEEREDLLTPDGSVPDVVVGVWKPISMTAPICDNPLAVLDASNWTETDAVAMSLTAERPITDLQDGVIKRKHTELFRLSSISLKWREYHKWWYFSNMTNEDVLVFTHYTKRKPSRVNPHTSIFFGDCGDHPQRVSIEARVVIKL